MKLQGGVSVSSRGPPLEAVVLLRCNVQLPWWDSCGRRPTVVHETSETLFAIACRPSSTVGALCEGAVRDRFVLLAAVATVVFSCF